MDTGDEIFQLWANTAQNDYLSTRQQEPFKFVEITKLPKKIDGRSLTSLIVLASKIVPKTTDICIKQDPHSAPEQVALIEFKSVSDAHKAVQRLKTAAFAQTWHIRIITNPKLAQPEVDLLRN